MVDERSYTTMDDTVRDVIRQARASVTAADDYVPSYITNPRQLWDYWKPLVTYLDDDKHPLSAYTSDEVDLIQHIDTMAAHNWHGDCDCFTVLILASCGALGWKCGIMLQGDDYDGPSHILPVVFWKNEVIPLDLTEPYYGTTRNYNYYQLIPVKMRVKLADGNIANVSDPYALSEFKPYDLSNTGGTGGTSVFDWANLLVGGASDIFGNIFGQNEPTGSGDITQLQLQQLQAKYMEDQQKLQSAKTNQYLFLGGGLLGGILLGTLIARK